MPQGRHGFTESTPDELQLDAGEIWANFDVEAFLEDAQDAETDVTDLADYGLNEEDAVQMGATRGGASFNANRDIAEIESDGQLGRTKGMRRRETVEPELEVEFLEFRETVLEKAIAGSVKNDVEAEGTGDITDVVEITGGEITTDAYIDNVVFIGKNSDGKPVIFELQNCLAEGDLAIDTDDQDEAVVPITFEGHFDIEDATYDEYGAREWVEPWRLVIYAETA